MTKGKKIAVVAGIVVAVGLGVAMVTSHPQSVTHQDHPVAIQPAKKTQSRPPAQKPTTQKPAFVPPKTIPTIPSTGNNSVTSAQTSLTALTQKEGVTTPTGPIDVVANLAKPSQRWAFATEAAKGASTGYTLWFGMESTKAGPWTWIPSTLPGALSSQLPPAVHSALLWAYDLEQGQSGPTLYGTVSWNSITGLVGEPQGWTAQESGGSLMLTVWMPSFYGSFHGFYGVETDWYPSTIASGQQGLSMIVPGGNENLSQLVNVTN